MPLVRWDFIVKYTYLTFKPLKIIFLSPLKSKLSKNIYSKRRCFTIKLSIYYLDCHIYSILEWGRVLLAWYLGSTHWRKGPLFLADRISISGPHVGLAGSSLKKKKKKACTMVMDHTHDDGLVLNLPV